MEIHSFIKCKKLGNSHRFDEIDDFIRGIVQEKIEEKHIAAWLMAVYFKGLDTQEIQSLTETMWKSGRTLERSPLDAAYRVDKHSTGGVGDKTSLILVPLVLSVCHRLFGPDSVKIPMVSGRTLGHTGGTLNKLESVPGFRTDLSVEQAQKLLDENGFCMMGQTAELAPADRVLYRIRDETETVDSLGLIISSILSKKFSENLDGLVMDIKCGHGSFLRDVSMAKTLADAMVSIGSANGCEVQAVLTSMNEPLGTHIGTLLEVFECEAYLSGEDREKGLDEVVRELAARMVKLVAGKKISLSEAQQACQFELQQRTALNYFYEMFRFQGGQLSRYHQQKGGFESEHKSIVLDSPIDGYLKSVDPVRLGLIANRLCEKSGGIVIRKKVGDPIKKGEGILKIYATHEASLSWAGDSLVDTFEVSLQPTPPTQWVLFT